MNKEAKDSALLSSRDAGLLEPLERPQGSPASSSVSLPLGLALGSPIFPSGCEGKLGVALESLQGPGGAWNATPRSLPSLELTRVEGVEDTQEPAGLLLGIWGLEEMGYREMLLFRVLQTVVLRQPPWHQGVW